MKKTLEVHWENLKGAQPTAAVQVIGLVIFQFNTIAGRLDSFCRYYRLNSSWGSVDRRFGLLRVDYISIVE